MNLDRFRVRVWNKRANMLYEPPLKSLGEYINGMQDTFEFMLCTGLKDSEGKLIWEGDVIEGPHDFGPGGWAVRKGVVEWSPIRGYQWEYWQVPRCKVIGNIYENPELLKRKP